MAEGRILVVEDDLDQRRLVASLLRSEGFTTAEAGSVDAALSELARSPVDLVLSDWKLPGRDGIELLEDLTTRYPEVAFIMVTAYGTIGNAVRAVRQGADDYLTKPFDKQTLLLSIERTLRSRGLIRENRKLAEALSERDRLVDLVGSSPSMQLVFRRVEKLAQTSATVLITGESGTGKELAARALHALSRRSAGPFVPVNCAAIPESLVESEFFGAEKGAFTGADKTRGGKFEAADGGTLFLDEIGELPLSLQPKLLRAIQEGAFSRVGGTAEIRTDVRIVAATNRDLREEVALGRFRGDLYYRLNVVPVAMPPLRDRREDIPELVTHFVARSERRHGLRVRPFPPALMRRLVDYAWPGNVRELAHAVERLVLLSEDGVVRDEDVPDALAARPAGPSGFRLPPGGISWEDHEKDCLKQALELASGNRTRAARLLDLPYKAFLYRLEKFGLAAGGKED
ncbi:MAG: Regulatory protein AtoC [Thermoanaerobaculia bacterium]|nr:Regulatory protein AtoC [Thermoanaerobaculia bacterium]